MKKSINSRKETVTLLGLAVFIIITSFKFGGRSVVIGLNAPRSLAYSNGIIYVVNKGEFLSVLGKDGNILELKFLDIYKPTSVATADDLLFIASENKLLVFDKNYYPHLLKIIKFNTKIRQIETQSSKGYVLLDNGDLLLMQGAKIKLLFKVPNAVSIALNQNSIFIAYPSKIVLADKNGNVVKYINNLAPISSINYSGNRLLVVLHKNNKVLLFNNQFKIGEQYYYELPSFAMYTNKKIFVSSHNKPFLINLEAI